VTVLLEDDFPFLVLQQSELAEPGVRTRVAVWLLAQVLFLPIGLCTGLPVSQGVRPVQRQQTKWVALAMGLGLVVAIAGVIGPLLFLDPSHPFFIWSLLIFLPSILLLPLSIAVAILRHGLFDIDHLISRTVTYTLLTLMLGTVYAVAVLVLGQVLTPVNPNSTLAVAVSTLVVVALFQPLRRRLQDRVDRRFNRRRHDAAKTIQAFNSRLRQEVDLDTVSAEVLAVVDQTMQPTLIALWLRPAATDPVTDRRAHSRLADGGGVIGTARPARTDPSGSPRCTKRWPRIATADADRGTGPLWSPGGRPPRGNGPGWKGCAATSDLRGDLALQA
jgi:hypothetical protein